MKFLDCEIGGRHYEEQLTERDFLAVEETEEAVEKITPDKSLALRLARAFNTLGYVDPNSRTSFHKRAAFLKALKLIGINFRVEYTELFPPRIFINDKHGDWIDIYTKSAA